MDCARLVARVECVDPSYVEVSRHSAKEAGLENFSLHATALNFSYGVGGRNR
jgi:hypothetical protein